MQTKRLRLFLAMLALVTGVLTAPPSPVKAAGRWTTTGSMAVARTYHTATLLPDGRVLVVGGYGDIGYYGDGSLASAELFNPSSGTWSPAAPLGTARQQHTTTLLTSGPHAGKVVVIGGYQIAYPGGVRREAALDSVEMYDPASDAWTPAGALTAARYGHAAVTLAVGPSAGKVLVIGGRGAGGDSLASTDRYDPATQTTSGGAAMTQARGILATATLPDGKVFAMGGYSYAAGTMADLFDPVANGWTATPPTTSLHEDAPGVVALPDGRVLVVGGDGDEADLYNPSTNSWAHAAPARLNLSFARAVLLPSGAVLLTTNVSARYNPLADAWEGTGWVPGAVDTGDGTLTRLADGRVLATGGARFQPVAGAALYDDTPYALALSSAPGGSATASPTPGPYTGGATVTLAATPAQGYLFTGWVVDGVLASYANPFTLDIIAASRTVVAGFAPIPAFPDVPPGHPTYQAVSELAARGTIRGYGNGNYGPGDGVQRAQMAALIARAMPHGPGTPTGGALLPPACVAEGTWDCEDWGNDFTDRGGIIDSLWRDAGTLQHYGAARGYTLGDCAAKGKAYPCFGPTDPVSYAQTVAFISRALGTKGFWQRQQGGAQPYAGVPAAHRDDLATFWHYTQGQGGVPTAPGSAEGWNAPATRGWFAQVLWQALASYYAGDHAP